MNKKQLLLLYAICIAAVVACFFVKPIRQDEAYHLFADHRLLFGIPNFWNVVSNLPFVMIGFIGLKHGAATKENALQANYIWFFTGILLTGFGSGYYHWNPDNTTLIWDRLPMTLSFMSFLSIIIGEFISPVSGKKAMYPLLLTGLASIANWVITKDLRMYALVQFLPIVLILVILFLSKKEQKHKKYFWLMVVFYAIAKFLESYDGFIYGISYNLISGHSLKHLAAAAAPFLFYKFAVRKFQH